jgi:hypothetical protein
MRTRRSGRVVPGFGTHLAKKPWNPKRAAAATRPSDTITRRAITIVPNSLGVSPRSWYIGRKRTMERSSPSPTRFCSTVATVRA